MYYWKTSGLEQWKKLGLGRDACSAINPKLIYCSISAFGHEGDQIGHADPDMTSFSKGWAVSQV